MTLSIAIISLDFQDLSYFKMKLKGSIPIWSFHHMKHVVPFSSVIKFLIHLLVQLPYKSWGTISRRHLPQSQGQIYSTRKHM